MGYDMCTVIKDKNFENELKANLKLMTMFNLRSSYSLKYYFQKIYNPET